MNIKPVFSILVFGLVGCGSAASTNDPSGSDGTTAQAQGARGEAPVVDANVSSASPPPVASLHLDNGNTIEFFDGGKEGILISETGMAYTTPALKSLDMQALGPVATWNALSPAVPAPQALVELQARANAYASAEGSPPAVAGAQPIDSPRSVGGNSEASTLTAPQKASTSKEKVAVVQEAVNACNNGCCDANWLVNDLCPLDGEDDWFYFDYGSSWEQNWDIFSVNEVVCAGAGTSTFGIHRGNYIATFAVTEGHYRSYFWFASTGPACLFGGCNSDNHSVVNCSSGNRPTTPALHTFCGYVTH